jgi:hypothetical protein
MRRKETLLEWSELAQNVLIAGHSRPLHFAVEKWLDLELLTGSAVAVPSVPLWASAEAVEA